MDMDDTSEVSTEPNIYMNSGYKWNNDNFEYQPTASPNSYKDNSEENQNYPPVSFYEQQQPPYENNSFYNPHSYHHSSQSPSHDRNDYPPSPNINKYDHQPTLLESHHDKYQHDLPTRPRPYIKYYYYHSPHYHDKNFEYPMPSLEENNLHSHKFYDRDNKANQLTSIKDESIEIDYLPSSREAAIDIRSIKASDID